MITVNVQFSENHGLFLLFLLPLNISLLWEKYSAEVLAKINLLTKEFSQVLLLLKHAP